MKGIEPSWPAWKAGALPLSYTREIEVVGCSGVTPLLPTGICLSYPRLLCQRLFEYGLKIIGSGVCFALFLRDFEPVYFFYFL